MFATSTRVAVAVALLCGCARDNPRYDNGAAGDGAGSGATGGQQAGTSTGSAPSSGPESDGGSTAEPPTTDDGTTSADIGTTGSQDSSTTGVPQCEITIPVGADTFVSNVEGGCEGASDCDNWAFTNTGARAIQSQVGNRTILLLRFETDSPVTNVEAARVQLWVNTNPAPPGLMEFQVLDSTSEIVEVGQSGTAQAGQPTWNNASHDVEGWRDADGEEVASFEALYAGWTTQLLLAGDEQDGQLELELTNNNLTAVRAALDDGNAVQLGVTFLSNGAIVAHARELGERGAAMLVLDRC